MSVSKRYITTGGVTLLSLICATLACQKSPKMEPWYIQAARYIEADSQMLQNATESAFLENLDRRHNAATLIAKDGAPSLATLHTSLHSTNELDRKVALVTIIMTKATANDLFDTILTRYRVTDDFFTKFYSQHSSQNLSDSQIVAFEDRFVSILDSEDNEVVLIAGMPTLIRLDSAKAKRLFVKYMETGTPGLQRMANVYVNKMGSTSWKQ